MANKMLEMAISIKGKLEKAYTDSMQRAIQEAGRLQQRLGGVSRAMQDQQRLAQQYKELRGIQGDIQRFRDLKRTVGESAAALAQAQETVRNMAAVMRNGGAATQSAIQAFERAKAKAAQLKQQFTDQRAALQQLRNSLSQAGYGTQNLVQNEARLRRELEQTTRAMEQAARAQEQLEARRSAQQAHGTAQQNFYNAVGNWQSGMATVQSIASPLTGAVENAMNFEHAMSKVKALTQSGLIREGDFAAVNDNMQKLEAQARQLGATTQFTMTQAAEAMSYLGMAGWKTEQIYGTMPGMLNLAAGAGTDLARTADIVSDNMTAMGVPVEKAGHFMDVYAYALTNANVNLESLGETMKYAAPVAAAFGASLEDTAAMTMMMGNAGIKGSMAGTALRMGLLRLSGPPKKATKEMEALGISVSDATAMAMESQAEMQRLGISIDENAPPMEKMSNIIRQLQTKMQGLSREEKLASIGAIFGANAASGWVNIIEQGADTFDKYRNALQSCDGYSKQFAETMNDDTRGAMIALDSAIDAVKNTIGTVFLPVVRQAAEALAPMATALAEWFSQNRALAFSLGAVVAGIAGVVMTALTVNVAVSGWRLMASTIDMVANSSRLLAIQTRIVTAAQAALNAVMAMNPYVLAVLAIVALIGAIILLNAKFEQIQQTASIVFNHISGTVSAMVERVKQAFGNALEKIAEVWNSITGQTMQSSEVIGAIINNIGFVLGAAFDIAAGVVGTAISAIIGYVAAAAQFIGGIVNLIIGIFTLDWDRAWKGAGQAVQGFVDSIAGPLKTIAGGIGDIFDTLMGKSHEVEAAARQAQAAAAGSQMSNSVRDDGNAQALANAQQVAAATQETAAATGEASANAQLLSADMQAAGENAQAATSAIQQMPEALQGAFGQISSQSQVAVQAVGTNLQQIPTETQAVMQQLPPIAQQGTDGIAQEWAQLATKCQPGGEAFVQAANQWGQQAYESIANWSGQMAQVVVDRLSSAWAQISAQFSAGLNVNVTTSGAASIAHNAAGGIYRKGAFLTTFAEGSAEAAIPLDGSRNAISLWQRAGEILGVLPQNLPALTEAALPSTEEHLAAFPLAMEPRGETGGGMHIEISMPAITIQGNADSSTVSSMEEVLARAIHEMERKFGTMLSDFEHQQRRKSYA